MMKKFIIIAFIILGAISCTSDFSDWNKDPKQATVVPASTLFSNAERNLVRTMKNQNVNINIFNFLAQYWTATTYPDEANYDLGTRDVPGNFWNSLYRDVLVDLQEATKVLNAEKENSRASLELLANALNLSLKDPTNKKMSYCSTPEMDEKISIESDHEIISAVEKAIENIENVFKVKV